MLICAVIGQGGEIVKWDLRFLVVAMFSVATFAHAAPVTLTMGVSEHYLAQPIQLLLDRMTAGSDDLRFKVMYYPRKRLFVELNNGTVDGDAMRFMEARPHIERDYPNIVMLREPMFPIDWVLLSNAQRAPKKTMTLHDVRNATFAIPRGSVVSEELFSNVQFTGTNQQAATMLQARRVDHIVGASVFGHLVIPEKLPQGLVVQAEPILHSWLTLCLHRKHSHLFAKIESLIRNAREKDLFRTWLFADVFK